MITLDSHQPGSRSIQYGVLELWDFEGGGGVAGEAGGGRLLLLHGVSRHSTSPLALSQHLARVPTLLIS